MTATTSFRLGLAVAVGTAGSGPSGSSATVVERIVGTSPCSSSSRSAAPLLGCGLAGWRAPSSRPP